MKIGLFYGSNNGNTARVAALVGRTLGLGPARNLRSLQARDLEGFDLLILGAPTWYMGELQDDWARIADSLAQVDLHRTRVALFGLGDQADYPDHFVDALGVLHELLVQRGAQLGYGYWPTDGYRFSASRAVRGASFCGLALDQANQADLTAPRVGAWCAQLRDELGLSKAAGTTLAGPSDDSSPAHAA